MQPLSIEQCLLLGLSSLVIVGTITPILRLVAKRYGFVDSPSESHKTHENPVPYFGGIGIAIGVVGVTYLASLVSSFSRETFFLASSVLFPAIILGVVGFIDDLRKLSPWLRFITQSIFGIAVSLLLVATNTLGSPFGINWLDFPITILFIVGITNSINFFDNIDGGASGAIALAAVFLFILSWQSGQSLIAALSIVLAGATLGFLVWNKPPARIYMGDAGALFLGFLIASLAIRFDPNPNNQIASYAIPLLLLAMPILDTSVAVASRIRRRVSPFQGGRDHLSHRLIRMGFTKRQSIMILWVGSMIFGFFAVAISNVSFSMELLLTILAGAVWVMLFVGFLKTADSQ
jgi:UDP-GlcNAc:undecaprenyl-phosphate GlcNAc-1-phosphate transferase